MLDAALVVVFQPHLGATGDVELAVWIVCLAVTASFCRVIQCRARNRRSEPRGNRWSKDAVHRSWSYRLPEFFFAVAILEECVLRSVVAEKVEIGMGKVCLETYGGRHACFFKRVEHVLPGVHATPADFTFGSETLTVLGSYCASALECFGKEFGIGCFIFGEVSWTACGVDTDDAIVTYAVCLEGVCNLA